MSSIVTITFETESVYSEKDIRTVTESAKEFISEIDDEANQDSVMVSAMNEKDARRQAASNVQDMLNRSFITGSVHIQIPGSGTEEPFTIHLTEGDDEN